MLKKEEGITAGAVIRSMKRLGFTKDEIYDTLTGTGLRGDDVQLLMDRIEIDFEDLDIDSRKSRISSEIEEVLDQKLKKTEIEIKSKIREFDNIVNSMVRYLEGLDETTDEIKESLKNTTESKQKNEG